METNNDNRLPENVEKNFADDIEKLVNMQETENSIKTTTSLEEEKNKIFGGESNKQKEIVDSSLTDEDKEKENDENNKEDETETDSKEESVDEINGIDYLKKLTGIEILNEEGKPVEFEDTLDGIAKYTESVVEIAKKQVEEETTKNLMDGLISEFPELPNIINHLKTYGTIQNYVPVTDYTKIKISEDNKIMQEQIIINDLLASGISGEDAKEMVNFYKDKGTLLDKAQNSLKKLQDLQIQEIKQREEQELLESKREQEENEKWYKEISTKINDGKINGYSIPASQKAKFYDYIAKPVNNEGYSQAAIDEYNSDIDTRLFLTYLRFNKFDLSTLVKDAVAESKVNSLNKYKKQIPGIGKTQASKQSSEFVDFSEFANVDASEYIKNEIKLKDKQK